MSSIAEVDRASNQTPKAALTTPLSGWEGNVRADCGLLEPEIEQQIAASLERRHHRARPRT